MRVVRWNPRSPLSDGCGRGDQEKGKADGKVCASGLKD